MKMIKISLITSLIGMICLGTISKVYGDTMPQVKTDVGITFIDGSPAPVAPSSNRLLPLNVQIVPIIFICAVLALLALGGLIVYIRKKGILRHEKK